jgi:hypothetical protein
MSAEQIRSAISGLLWPSDGILGKAPPPYWHGSSGDTTHPRIALRWCFLPKLGTRRKTAGSLSFEPSVQSGRYRPPWPDQMDLWSVVLSSSPWWGLWAWSLS